MGVKLDRAFRDTLQADELLTADTTLGAAGVFVQIGEGYEVPAGQAIQFGQGTIRSQEGAVGRIYIDMVDDAAAAEDGVVRLVVENPTGTERVEIGRWPTERLRSGDADTLVNQLTFPLDGRWFPANSRIIIEMAPDEADDTIDVSACTCLVDIMRAPFVPGV